MNKRSYLALIAVLASYIIYDFVDDQHTVAKATKPQSQNNVEIVNAPDYLGYAFGNKFALDFEKITTWDKVNGYAFCRGFEDVVAGRESLLDQDRIALELDAFAKDIAQNKRSEKQSHDNKTSRNDNDPATTASNESQLSKGPEIQNFSEWISKRSDVKKLSDDLFSEQLHAGNGIYPADTDLIDVRYNFYILDKQGQLTVPPRKNEMEVSIPMANMNPSAQVFMNGLSQHEIQRFYMSKENAPKLLIPDVATMNEDDLLILDISIHKIHTS